MTESRRGRVSYELAPDHTALLGVDIQLGFGREGRVPVPHADAAVANFIALADAWRAAGGTVMHVYTAFTDDIRPTGNMTDHVPDMQQGMAEGSQAVAFYPGVVAENDILIRKTSFSAVAGSDVVDVLAKHGFDSAIVGGLTTPICVQTTVDGLSMAGVRVAVLKDATASQAIGEFSAEEAHDMAIQRMGHLFAQVTSTDEVMTTLSPTAATRAG